MTQLVVLLLVVVGECDLEVMFACPLLDRVESTAGIEIAGGRLTRDEGVRMLA